MSRYEAEIRALAERRERHALALLSGADNAPDIRADLRQAGRQMEALQDAEALSAYRRGEPGLAWPSRAPWSGF